MQAGGQRFDSAHLHHFNLKETAVDGKKERRRNMHFENCTEGKKEEEVRKPDWEEDW